MRQVLIFLKIKVRIETIFQGPSQQTFKTFMFFFNLLFSSFEVYCSDEEKNIKHGRLLPHNIIMLYKFALLTVQGYLCKED